jgi:hypothetical protein
MNSRERRSQRLQVEDMKIWDSTQIYNSGRISGSTDKGIATKARYLSTHEARSGNCPWRLDSSIVIVEYEIIS